MRQHPGNRVLGNFVSCLPARNCLVHLSLIAQQVAQDRMNLYYVLRRPALRAVGIQRVEEFFEVRLSHGWSLSSQLTNLLQILVPAARLGQIAKGHFEIDCARYIRRKAQASPAGKCKRSGAHPLRGRIQWLCRRARKRGAQILPGGTHVLDR